MAKKKTFYNIDNSVLGKGATGAVFQVGLKLIPWWPSFGTTTLSTTTLSIMTFSIKGLYVALSKDTENY